MAAEKCFQEQLEMQNGQLNVWRGLRSAVTALAPHRGAWGYGLQDGSWGALTVNASDGPGNAEPLSTRTGLVSGLLLSWQLHTWWSADTHTHTALHNP
eukprot:s992_g2.t1